MRHLATAALLALVTALPALADDLVIKQRTTMGSGGEQRTREETQYVTDTLVVVESPDSRTLVDLDGERMTIADKDKKSYFEITFAELQKQGEAVQKKMAELPPEARQQMEGMFGKGEPVVVTPTGKTEKIAGYTAKEYALKGGPFSGTVWSTEDMPVPVAMTKWRELSSKSAAHQGPAEQLTKALAQIKGVPLRTTLTTRMGGGELLNATEVLEISKASPPADVKKIPDGFTQTPAPRLE
ncbi:MAG: DUF4412 domain-containing protein [bacterium]|nr:DUF4412 domain-containing protein [bacterium]